MFFAAEKQKEGMALIKFAKQKLDELHRVYDEAKKEKIPDYLFLWNEYKYGQIKEIIAL